MYTYQLYLEHSFGQNKPYTYYHEQYFPIGSRVMVPLRNRQVVAFVFAVQEGLVESAFEIKRISYVIDQEPIINQELMDLASWLSYETISPLIKCLQTILPNQLRPKSNFKKIQMTTWVKVKNETLATTQKQQQVLNSLKNQPMLVSEARKKFKSIINTLLKKEALELYQQEKTYISKKVVQKSEPLTLTESQQAALAAIVLNKSHTYVLFGKTGSGKTEVYLQCAAKVIQNKKQVLILVPEIALTPQMISRFQDRFGKDVGIYHSGLNDQEKYEQYLRVKNNEVSIVVGTRSCVFLPFKQLGLIVIDEEHDSSFKQEATPFYHCHQVALYRSQKHQCPLILGSASPSLETFARAVKKVYTLLTLPQRINLQLPTSEIVDTSISLKKLKYFIISERLKEAMEHTLQHKQQVMLLLNRRSYSPLVECVTCHSTLMCPDCDVALSYHQDDDSYHCHSCNYVTADKSCPNCHSQTVIYKGVGTQQLEAIVKNLFPQAKVARLDTDTTKKKNYHQHILEQFNQQKIDILIGTQMIAKGLDNPNVTLVGILNAQQALLHQDYTASEKAFQLILQAAGRSGRSHLKGHVILQTNNPSHYSIQLALKQDYLSFFNQEMKYRHIAQNPPYTYLIELLFSHMHIDPPLALATFSALWLKQQEELIVLGPAKLRKLRKYERVRIILKTKEKAKTIQILHEFMEMIQSKKQAVLIQINVMPSQLAS